MQYLMSYVFAVIWPCKRCAAVALSSTGRLPERRAPSEVIQVLIHAVAFAFQKSFDRI